MPRVLKLNQAGVPAKWVTQRRAAEYYAHSKVLWDLADEPVIFTGGTNQAGLTSRLEVAPIIAVKGEVKGFTPRIGLTNETLFARDEFTCQYCGAVGGKLTRDHIIPRGQGGPDVWTNVVAACSRCNSHKGCRTPAQAGMQLMAVPYEPNWFEFIFLKNRKSTTDYQLEYLSSGFKNINL